MKTNFIKIYEELSILNESSWIGELETKYNEKNSDIFSFPTFNEFKNMFPAWRGLDKQLLNQYYEFLLSRFINYGNSRYSTQHKNNSLDKWEGHHIVPNKSNDITNLIALTRSDHKIAHKKLLGCLCNMWLKFIQEYHTNTDNNINTNTLTLKTELSLDNSVDDVEKESKQDIDELLNSIKNLLSSKISVYEITWVEQTRPKTKVFSKDGAMKLIIQNCSNKKELKPQAIYDWCSEKSKTFRKYGVAKIEKL